MNRNDETYVVATQSGSAEHNAHLLVYFHECLKTTGLRHDTLKFS